MSSAEVQLIPLAIGLTVIDALLTYCSVGEKMIDKFDWEYLDLTCLFKSTDVDVIALCDIEEDTIDEEQERFNVEILAPRQAQIEEELRQSLIVDTFAIKFSCFTLLANLSTLFTLLQASFLLIIHESLVFFVKLFTALFLWVVRFLVLIFINSL